MRLYLQTLQTRDIDESKRREFYDIMLADSDRLMGTIEQVLAGGADQPDTSRSQPIPGRSSRSGAGVRAACPAAASPAAGGA